MTTLTQQKENVYTANNRGIEYSFFKDSENVFSVWRKHKSRKFPTLSVFTKQNGNYIDNETKKKASKFIQESLMLINS